MIATYERDRAHPITSSWAIALPAFTSKSQPTPVDAPHHPKDLETQRTGQVQKGSRSELRSMLKEHCRTLSSG